MGCLVLVLVLVLLLFCMCVFLVMDFIKSTIMIFFVVTCESLNIGYDRDQWRIYGGGGVSPGQKTAKFNPFLIKRKAGPLPQALGGGVDVDTALNIPGEKSI